MSVKSAAAVIGTLTAFIATKRNNGLMMTFRNGVPTANKRSD